MRGGRRAPDFWAQRPPAWEARLLAPLGAAYGAVAAARLARPAPRAALPVIAIGGVTLGGDGKTPLALAIARLLSRLGERPAFLTRGYGRRGSGAPFRVDLQKRAAPETGDEPRLLARAAPTIVCADRVAAARLAQEVGATVLILDDGLHSRRLAPDLALLAVDGGYGAGNGLCPPAGPLRAPAAAQLAAADAVVVIGPGAPGEAIATRAAGLGKTLLRGRLVPSPEAAARLAGARLFAFAGVARPQKFLASLHEIGAEVVGRRWFGDHHAYRARELAALTREARRLGAGLVTTEKDAARLNAGFATEILPVELDLDADARVVAALCRTRLNRGA